MSLSLSSLAVTNAPAQTERTLIRRETIPVSEGQSIVRSQYRVRVSDDHETIGLHEWEDYEVSVDVESLENLTDARAGIVFHSRPDDPTDFYYFCVRRDTGDKGTCQLWKYENDSPVQKLAEEDVTIDLPMTLRVTRPADGSFLCYAGGVHINGLDTSYPAGRAGLLATATAWFDNFKVFGQNGFLTEEGSYEVLFEDPFYRLDLDGDPYMWGLMGEDPINPGGSAWKVVDGGAGYGKVLRGTASGDPNLPTLAIRGDRGWINKEGESDYMNYRIMADVKLETDSAVAGVCLRVKPTDNPGYRYYRLSLVGPAFGQQAKLELSARRWVPFSGGSGIWVSHSLAEAQLPAPGDWHAIELEAIDRTLKCYLDGAASPCISFTEPVEQVYPDGLVGLSVGKDKGLFDNVKVLDLRGL